MSDDLAAWLLQQIAEDERYAREEASESPPWAWAVFRLAECDAKRRIIAMHAHEELRFEALARITSVPAEQTPYRACVACGERTVDGDLAFPTKEWCDTLKLLALPYADRPGYRSEWAP